MKQSSLTNQEFRVVELALKGASQNEIGRQLGLNRVTAHRLVNREHIQEQIETLRAASMMKAWTQFDELLGEALTQLLAIMRSPMTEKRDRIRIALKLAQLGLEGGVLPTQQNLTVVAVGGGPDERGGTLHPAPVVVGHPHDDNHPDSGLDGRADNDTAASAAAEMDFPQRHGVSHHEENDQEK